MSEYVTLECKHCGNAERSEFIIRKGEYICKCCGRCYKEKAADEETRLAIAYESLKNYEFEFAERTFSDIINDYPNSVDARWGVLLARYGIVFVKGFYMEEIEPIYCFPNYAYKKGSFKTEAEYREIEKLLGGDIERMYLYTKQADEIERAFKMFADDIDKKENDVFICVKISKTTAANPCEKGRTVDYEKAHELYDKLRSRGKNVFFSYVTLKNSIDSDMEIWRNMLKSRKMLIIGSRAEYLNSVWVKSEWERWLMLDKADEKGEHKKNMYIYMLGDENENLYSKLPAGLKRLHPQIYTKNNEADLINDICGVEESKPAEKNKRSAQRVTASEKNDVTENVEPYVSFLGGRIEKLTSKSAIKYSGRSDVEKVILPEGIKKIEAGFFSNCANLIYIKIPQSVKIIEAGAFSGCQKLASI